MEELLEQAAGRFVTCKAVPMPAGPYLRTWLVYSGKTSPLSRCRLDSGPLSLLGLGASIGRGWWRVLESILAGFLAFSYPFSRGERFQNYPKKAYSGY